MLAKEVGGRPAKARDYAKEAEIAADYMSGEKLAPLMRRHGLSCSALYSILDSMGVPRRTRKAAEGAKRSA